MRILLIFLFAFAVVATACKKEDDSVSPGNTSSTLQTGVWKVAYYYDKDKDETSHYSSYEFEFMDDGSLKIVNSSSQTTGSWSTYDSDGVSKMNLNAGSTDPLSDLTDDWKIVENTDDKIKLEDESGDGSMEYLDFVKL